MLKSEQSHAWRHGEGVDTPPLGIKGVSEFAFRAFVDLPSMPREFLHEVDDEKRGAI